MEPTSTHNITLFNVYSNYNKVEDFLNGIAEIHVYESILDNTVRMSVVMADTGNREGQEGFAALERGSSLLTAGEKVEIVLEDGQLTDTGQGNRLVFKDDYHLRIKEVKHIQEDTQKMTFTLDLYSNECIQNELVENRVQKRYDGKISDHVNKILKTDCIKTPKNVDIDSGLNLFNFVGGIRPEDKPFQKLIWLAKRCVPEMQNSNGILAGYFFYEIADDGYGNGGFKFKSIDKLFEQKPKKKLIFNNTTSLPEEYDAKILYHHFDNTVDLHQQLKSGGLTQTEIRTLNLYSTEYKGEKQGFSVNKQLSEQNMGGIEIPKIASDLDLQNKTTRVSTRITSPGYVASGQNINEKLEKSKELNFDLESILRQSYMRYNNLFTTKLTITIFLDLSLHVGDLLHCDFPEISDKENQEVSYRKSGIYMIVDLCHFIPSPGIKNRIPEQPFTKLNLVRESFGRKPF